MSSLKDKTVKGVIWSAVDRTQGRIKTIDYTSHNN